MMALCIFQFIAHPANHHDEIWSVGILLDLVSERMNMDVQGVEIEGILFSPHAAQHGLPRKGLARRLKEALENGEFFWRQRYQLSFHCDFMLIEIHLEISHPKNLRCVRVRLVPTQEGPDLCDDLSMRLSRQHIVDAGFHVP
jgi:hypothetical protein